MDTPKPGDFPIGSVESRAAMRFELSNQRDERRVLLIASHIPRVWRGEGPKPSDWHTAPSISDPQPCSGDLYDVMQILYVPDGMTTDEARKVVGI